MKPLIPGQMCTYMYMYVTLRTHVLCFIFAQLQSAKFEETSFPVDCSWSLLLVQCTTCPGNFGSTFWTAGFRLLIQS